LTSLPNSYNGVKPRTSIPYCTVVSHNVESMRENQLDGSWHLPTQPRLSIYRRDSPPSKSRRATTNKKAPSIGQNESALPTSAVLEELIALESHMATTHNMTKQGTHTTTTSIVATLPARTTQTTNGPVGVGDEDILHTSQVPQHKPTTPREEYTSFPHPSAEVASSVFPFELPPRPPPKQSTLSLPARSIQAAQANRDASDNQAFILQGDIDMSNPSVRTELQHDLEMLTRTNRMLKVCLLVSAG